MFNQYVLILVWIGLMALLQGSFYREEYNKLTGERQWRTTPFFAFLVIVPLIWMTANRGNIGDTYTYVVEFVNMPDSFSGISDYISKHDKDVGFYYLSAIIRIVFGNDRIIYFLVLALIQGCIVGCFFRKYSSNYVLSIFLFIASADYLSWMYNGIRQFTAVTISLVATKYILDKKSIGIKAYALSILIVILASTMHQSALLVIPFIFIAQGDAWNKKTLLFIGVSLLVVVFVGRFTSFLDNALASTQYANVVSDYTEWQDDGTNPIRVLVYSMPAILSFFGRRKIELYGGNVINFCVNMSIISMGLYLISMVTSGIFLGRLPIYCSLFGYVLIPWEMDNLFSESNNKFIKCGLVLAYLFYYYYQVHVTWGIF